MREEEQYVHNESSVNAGGLQMNRNTNGQGVEGRRLPHLLSGDLVSTTDDISLLTRIHKLPVHRFDDGSHLLFTQRNTKFSEDVPHHP